MLINGTNLALVFQALTTTFAGAFKGNIADTFYDKISMVVPSSTASNVYPLLARTVVLREWLGERVSQSIAAYDYTLKNKDYEGTLEVKRNDIDDDQLGWYSAVTVPALAEAAAKHWDRLMAPLLISGKTVDTYDGKKFFATDHPISKVKGNTTSQPNLFTTKPLNRDNAADIRAKMRVLKGDDGSVLGINPNTLIVPPSLEDTANKIANAELIVDSSTAATNTQRGTWKVLVIPELVDETVAGTWYAADLSKPIKPLITQIRRMPNELVTQINPNDPSVFKRNVYEFGVSGRGAVGLGLWQLIARCEA